MKSPANNITILRILCSIVMLFFSAFSTAFYALYITAGVSDMLDGWVARRIFEFLPPLQQYKKDILSEQKNCDNGNR